MARIRFTTVRDLYEAFASAQADIRVEASDEAPLRVMRMLVGTDSLYQAAAMCAYLLPRREAVWWACEAVRSLVGLPFPTEEENLQAAENWVREPEDAQRRVALELGARSDQSSPATWAALAAGWSGGNIGLDGAQMPALPFQTAKAAYSAVMIGVSRVVPADQGKRLRGCIDRGIRLVDDDRD